MLWLKELEISLGDFTLKSDVEFGGRITALLGPSGAGKSSILNVIAGYLQPKSGAVLWNGEDITPLAPTKRPVAMLFQDNNLFPHLNVSQNLALALTQKRPSAAELNQIEQALTRVDLAGFGPRRPAELSGGQQSRVALARILLQARPLMLLDESFGALGPALRAEMLDLVAAVTKAENMQAIMVTHDPADALRIADETAIVADGTLGKPTETQSLFTDRPAALRAYLGDHF